MADKGVEIPQGQKPPGPNEEVKAAEPLQAGLIDFPDEEEHRRAEQEVGGLMHVGAFGGPFEAKGQDARRGKQQQGENCEDDSRGAPHGVSLTCFYSEHNWGNCQ